MSLSSGPLPSVWSESAALSSELVELTAAISRCEAKLVRTDAKLEVNPLAVRSFLVAYTSHLPIPEFGLY